MNKIAPRPEQTSPHPPGIFGNDILPMMSDPTTMDSPEQLMPYGTVAKAIFVKANGLAAYKLGMRVRKYTD